MDNTEQTPVAQLEIPLSGGGCGVIFLVAFVGFFVALAINHLAHFSETHTVGIVCAVLWLTLVAVSTLGGVQAAGGIRSSVVAILGTTPGWWPGRGWWGLPSRSSHQPATSCAPGYLRR